MYRKQAYDLIFEQSLGLSQLESISAEPSRKLGPHAFTLRSGKGKKFDLEAASEGEAQRWIRTINDTSGPAGVLASNVDGSSHSGDTPSEPSSGPSTPRTPRN